MQPTIIQADRLRVFVERLFSSAGMQEDFASIVSEALVWANLRGADTHGVARVPRYLEMMAQGIMNGRACPVVRKQTAGTLVLDGDRAPGPVMMSMAAASALEKAKAAGIGAAVIAHTTHTGALGFYARRVTAEGCIFIAACSSTPNMPYHGTKDAAVATNPICIGVPRSRQQALVLDMATSVVSLGKLILARRTGEPLMPGWAIDAAGAPTTDPQRAALPLPLAGPKGAGLSLMIELLTSLLAENPIFAKAIASPKAIHRQNAIVIAIDISAFTELSLYEGSVDELARRISEMERQPGFDKILMPGDRGDEVSRERSLTGIPIPPVVWNDLTRLGTNAGIDV